MHRRAALSLIGCLSLGCSDDNYRLGGASTAAVAAEATCRTGAAFELIDSMEDGDGAIEMLEGRSGVWFAFNDKTGGAQLPASDEETFVMSTLDPPRGDSRSAARTQGSGFTKWGAGIGFELYSQRAYDLSRYAGITFSAKRTAGTADKLRFALTDVATTPRGGQCRTYVDYSDCSDHFGVNITLDTEFRSYSFAWSDLKQVGWGKPKPPAIDTTQVYGVRFQTDTVEDFDFWIDDIALICR